MSVTWIAVDWGTTNLRLWAMDTAGRVIAEARSGRGMGGLAPDEFEPVLLGELAPYLRAGAPLRVMCCGMVGSRQGWAEAPYRAAPCAPPDGASAVRVAGTDPRIAVYVVPGIKQSSPPDVMRGEETQIAGYLRHAPDFDGVLCLPGTHSKWARISAGEIVGFRTFMTGELFALLAEQSVLRHSVGGPDEGDDGAFTDAVAAGLSRPDDLAAQLFRLRAASLVADMGAAEARARLSGLLIGAELAATKPYWLGQNVALIGADALSGLYRAALAGQGVSAHQAKATDMTLAGLIAAHGAFQETTE